MTKEPTGVLMLISKSMYKEVYSEMVAGVMTMKLDTPVWLNSVSKIVE